MFEIALHFLGSFSRETAATTIRFNLTPNIPCLDAFFFFPLSKMRLIHRNSIVCRRRKFGTCYCQKRVLITKKVDFPSERIAVTRIFPIVLLKLIMASLCFAHCLRKDLVTFYSNRFCFLICTINLQICDCFCLPNIVRCPSCGRYINVFEFLFILFKRERVWKMFGTLFHFCLDVV